MRRHKHIYLVLLAIITLLGAFLRFHQLGERSLWHDEIVEYTIASNPNILDVIKESYEDSWSPIDQVIMHYFLYFGDSEFFARLHAVLFGILSIILLFFLARLLFDTEVALVSALMLAISPFAIRYCQEARVYSTLLFFTMLHIYIFFKLFLSDKKIKYYILLFLTGVIILYLHYLGFVIFVPVLLISALKLAKEILSGRTFRESIRGFIYICITYALIGLSFLPSYLYFLKNLQAADFDVNPGYTGPIFTSLYSFFCFGLGNTSFQYVYLVFGISMIIMGLVKSKSISIEVLLLMTSFIYTIILMNLTKHWLSARYVLISLPYILLGVSLGIVEITKSTRKASLLSGFILMVAILQVACLLQYIKYSPREHPWGSWKKIANNLSLVVQENDVILFLTPLKNPVIPEFRGLNIVKGTKTCYNFYFSKYISKNTILDGSKESIEAFNSMKQSGQSLQVYFVQPYVFYDTLPRDHLIKREFEIADFSNDTCLVLKKKYAANGTEKILQDALEVNPYESWLYNQLANIVIENGDLDSAESLFDKSIASEPKNVLNNLLVGRFYLQKRNNPHKALSYFKSAVNLFETKEARVSQEQQKWAYTELGRAYRLIGNYEQAIIALDKALKIKGDNEWAFTELAQVYQAQKEYEKAIDTFKLAIELSQEPQDTTYIVLGRCLWEADNKEEALKILKEATELFPQSEWAKKEYKKYSEKYNKEDL